MNPAVSVVITTYDRVDRLRRAVDSVLGQDFEAFELIVVDDGSSDGTADYLSSVDDDRLVTDRQDNAGACRARNRGLEMAQGEWVIFLDDDDWALDGWLSGLMAMCAADVGLVTCGAIEVDPQGNELGTKLPTTMGPAFDGVTALLLGGTMAMTTSAVREIGGYWPELECSHQTDLSFRLLDELDARSLRVASVQRPLVAIERRAPSEHWRSRPTTLFAGTTRIIGRHGARLRRDKRVLADYEAVAGVAAARSGDWKVARQYLGRAALRNPRQPKHLVRASATFVPAVGRRVWGVNR